MRIVNSCFQRAYVQLEENGISHKKFLPVVTDSRVIFKSLKFNAWHALAESFAHLYTHVNESYKSLAPWSVYVKTHRAPSHI